MLLDACSYLFLMRPFSQRFRNTGENLVKIVLISVAAALQVFDQTIMQDPSNYRDEVH
jgi:hypothetical protein